MFIEPYLNNTVDIDRLHTVISQRFPPRRAGKTFSQMMLMLGEAQVGDPSNIYLFIGQTHRLATTVMKEMHRLFEHEGFIVHHRLTQDRLDVARDFFTCSQQFLFTSIGPNLVRQVSGKKYANVFEDLPLEAAHHHSYELEYARNRINA